MARQLRNVGRRGGVQGTETTQAMAHRLIDELVSDLGRLQAPGAHPAQDTVLRAYQEVSLAAEAFTVALTSAGSLTQSQTALVEAQALVHRARGTVRQAEALQEQVRARRRV
jgi:hypothetical protein